MNNRLYFSKNDHILTPRELLKELDKEFHFDFDPCPAYPKYDGLEIPWGKRNYVNPPYSEVEKWIMKAIYEMKTRKATSVFLITLRTNTDYWRTLILPYAKEIRLLGKITFQGFNKPFPVPLALVIIAPTIKNRKIIKKKTYSYFKFE